MSSTAEKADAEKECELEIGTETEKARKTEKIGKNELNEIYSKFDKFKVPEFSVRFRGYDRLETDKYLSSLVDAYNLMFDEYTEISSQLDEYKKKKEAVADALIEAKLNARSIIREAVMKACEISPQLSFDQMLRKYEISKYDEDFEAGTVNDEAAAVAQTAELEESTPLTYSQEDEYSDFIDFTTDRYSYIETEPEHAEAPD